MIFSLTISHDVLKVPGGSSNKEDCESGAHSDDRKSAPDDENKEDTFDEEGNSSDRRSAPDVTRKNIRDKEAISDTQHLAQENILGENENIEKINQDEDTKKVEEKVA